MQRVHRNIVVKTLKEDGTHIDIGSKIVVEAKVILSNLVTGGCRSGVSHVAGCMEKTVPRELDGLFWKKRERARRIKERYIRTQL